MTLKPAFSPDSLLTLLAQGMSSDWLPLSRRIRRLHARGTRDAEIDRVARAVAASRERALARDAARPRVVYPPDLPIAGQREEIAAAIRDHPLVIVCGETGSGKTTQLPKICLELGRGVRGLIGHTQPRRIAARSVAARIAQELGGAVGNTVGYKVRFTDRTGPDAYIKLMTDGILLAETQGDPRLSAYDTIIVDEAHERSLNIDFLLGYLKRLLSERDDLKVIITSATLDAQRFAAHFGEGGSAAPVIEVSGRTYPVDVRYRAPPQDDDDEEPLEQAIVAASEELWREGPGDILVFLPGEREIRETAELLQRSLARKPYAAAIEVLPLYARLSVEQQQRVFAPSAGRRVVLATNVAETSLTVPGIRSVIDTGLARIKRYAPRNKVTLLQIEKIARAPADQRAGRCGRVGPGVCVRLYDEQDFAARPEYAEPEILRSSLAAVILRMAALDLGPVDAFPFVEPPGTRAIADGYQSLQELGAVDDDRKLTALGRELSRLPLDPRLGRMLLAARDAGCLAEVMVIASALSVPDPRERPLDKQQAADQAHLRFRDERSDFLSLLALWQFFDDALSAKLAHRALVDRCRTHFVSYLRLREWRDLHHQLTEQVRELGWKWTDALPDAIDDARYAAIHRALLAGLLSNIGTKADDGEHYLGARGIRFYLHPGSGMARRNAKWVLAAELTETTRLYARCAARIEPAWIEAVAGDRVERSVFDPRWDRERGEVVAAERVSLYGLTLVARRRVSFGRIEPVAAREIFLREALAADDIATDAPFLAHNRAQIAEVAELEHKARRQDVLVDEDAIAAFYAERVPADVHSTASFERWRRDAEGREPKLLFMTREALMRHAASTITEVQYPDFIDTAAARLPLSYRFAPGHPEDGVTVTVPLALLNQLDEAALSWLVPGLIREKIAALIKALPKAWRNRLTPVPEVVTAFLIDADAIAPGERGRVEDALRSFCARRLLEAPPLAAAASSALPAHLSMNIRVVDAAGKELAQGRDLAVLRAQLGDAAQWSFSAGAPIERSGIRAWDLGDLPESIAIERAGRQVTGYPALVDDGGSVSLKLYDTRAAADAATRVGVLRLLRLQLGSALRGWEKPPAGYVATALSFRPAVNPEALWGDVQAAIADRALIGDDALPRSERAFVEQLKRARTRLPAVAEGAFRMLSAIGAEYHALSQQLAALSTARARLGREVAQQRDALVYAGFFAATPWAQLSNLPRFLQALQRRLSKAPGNSLAETRHAPQVAALWERYRARLDANRAAQRVEPALETYRWLIEELRVSLFAQELRAAVPVSYKRLEKAWAELLRG
ncbi:MAG TPA: ATP-dependent RNA helicase HrpA [Casimicrobiaceae bacterium]